MKNSKLFLCFITAGTIIIFSSFSVLSSFPDLYTLPCAFGQWNRDTLQVKCAISNKGSIVARNVRTYIELNSGNQFHNPIAQISKFEPVIKIGQVIKYNVDFKNVSFRRGFKYTDVVSVTVRIDPKNEITEYNIQGQPAENNNTCENNLR